ncbi:MAG: AAA family ATPase [Candidatus Aenigmarchaeota archaeon]|nr:AAA family ATPase [Candidatus Aenigmarchaeota archaeon]
MPKTSKEIIGNRIALQELMNSLKNWQKGQAALISGETGVGKTLAVRIAAHELGYEIIETGADEERGQKDMTSLIQASRQHSLAAKKKLFLLDEMDQLESAAAILQLISTSEHPVVLIVNDPYDKKLYDLRQRCRLIKFQRVRTDTIAKFLRNVCTKEGVACTQDLDHIAQMSNGDVRAALLDLELLCAGKQRISDIGYREHSSSVFETLKVIFKTSSLENALIAMNNAEDPEELHRWIAENIAEEYDDIEDVAKAYDMISKADLFHARIIRRQSWSLQKYFFQLSTAGVALAKRRDYNKFVKYNRPKFQYSRANGLMKHIAPKLHVSARKAVVYRPLIKKLSNDQKLLAELGVNREELQDFK